MIPGLCNLLKYIQGLLGSSQAGRGEIFDREQSRDLLPHGTKFQDYAGSYRGSLGMQRMQNWHFTGWERFVIIQFLWYGEGSQQQGWLLCTHTQSTRSIM